MPIVYIGLGSNEGNRKENLKKAIDHMSNELSPVIKASYIYETEPWGFETDHWFLNQVILMETAERPLIILRKLLHIESIMGRKPTTQKNYTSRIIDLDLLLYDDLIVQTNELIIPHPRMHQRRFVLIPMTEIAPDVVHPIFKKNMEQLLDECFDVLEVKKVK